MGGSAVAVGGTGELVGVAVGRLVAVGELVGVGGGAVGGRAVTVGGA